MACSLTSGYSLDCRDNVGGIKLVYLTELANITASTVASGVVTAITKSGIFRTYELQKETGVAEWSITTNDNNGTVYTEQKLTMPIRKQQASMAQEIMLLAKNRLAMIVLDRNGKYFIYGLENGMEMQTSAAAFGTAMGDFNGYTLQFMGKEKNEPYEVSSGIIAGLLS